MTTLRTELELYTSKERRQRSTICQMEHHKEASWVHYYSTWWSIVYYNWTWVAKYRWPHTLTIWQSMGVPSERTVYEQMTTALKKIEIKAMQLGLKLSSEKCEALWYRSVDPDWNFKIAGVRIPWRTSVKYLGVIIDKRLNFGKQVDYVRQKTDSKMHLLKVLNSLSDVNASISKNIYTTIIQSTFEYGAVTFGMMVASNIARLQAAQN